MPTKVEKDEYSGQETTGHEWDGIKELNTPLPKWWLYVLDWDRRAELQDEIAAARAEQQAFMQRIDQASVAAVRADDELRTFALAGGRTLFGENCAPCHGAGGGGRPGGYPSLADDAWIWGGAVDDIHQTIQYGIRSDHPDARFSEMPAFGADDILPQQEVLAVAEYVLQISDQEHDAALAERGATVYAENCAACHGDDGAGMTELGAPDLTDQVWLYGGSRADIVAQIGDPQLGVMPAWTGRLDPVTIKMLAVYVHAQFGGGQ
jgi:cytochrome c oxidase cbb3-type subunit 3